MKNSGKSNRTLVGFIGLLFIASALSGVLISKTASAGLEAESTDSIIWNDQGLVLDLGGVGQDLHVFAPCVLRGQDGTYTMWYTGDGDDGLYYYQRIFKATSPDGVVWTKGGIALDHGGAGQEHGVLFPYVINIDGIYHMWYAGINTGNHASIFRAVSYDGGNTWTKCGQEIDYGDSVDISGAWSQTVQYDGTQWHMWYASIIWGTPNKTKINHAHKASLEDPWIKDGTVIDVYDQTEYTAFSYPWVMPTPEGYEMYYTAYEAPYAGPVRILHAASDDGLEWERTGIAYEGTSELDNDFVGICSLMRDQGTLKCWYSGYDGSHWRIFYTEEGGEPQFVDISVSDVQFSNSTPAAVEPVTISAAIHGDPGDTVSTEVTESVFFDDFDSGSLSNWILSTWNYYGVLEVSDEVSSSQPYSFHAQSDPYTNTGPYILKYLPDCYDHLIVQTAFYLPTKTQMIDKWDVLRVGSSTGTNLFTTNYDFYLALRDDDYSLDMLEYVLEGGSWTFHSVHNDFFELAPNAWHDIRLELSETEYSIHIDGILALTGQRTVSAPLHHIILGDEGGAGGCWGDAYWDDVEALSVTGGSATVPGLDAECTVSFYLDVVSEASLIGRKVNVPVPAGQTITASTTWTAVPGTHEILVVVSDVDPTDSDMSNNAASATIIVSETNILPVADAGPDRTALVGSGISFDGSGSFDPDGYLASYAWNFGDGTTATGLTANHSYMSKGNYTVTLTVTDNDGATGSDSCLVVVTCPCIVEPGPSNITITKVKTVGPDVVETHTRYAWELQITVANNGESGASGITVRDVLPAELMLNGHALARGEFAYAQNGGGRTGSTRLEWRLGTLAPGETEVLTLWISTRPNPAGMQEFTSPGTYSLNDGAWLVGTDDLTGDPIGAGPTDPIYVTAVDPPETGAAPGRITPLTGPGTEPPVMADFTSILDTVRDGLTSIPDDAEMTESAGLENENLNTPAVRDPLGMIAAISLLALGLLTIALVTRRAMRARLTQGELDRLLASGRISETEYLRRSK